MDVDAMVGGRIYSKANRARVLVNSWRKPNERQLDVPGETDPEGHIGLNAPTAIGLFIKIVPGRQAHSSLHNGWAEGLERSRRLPRGGCGLDDCRIRRHTWVDGAMVKRKWPHPRPVTDVIPVRPPEQKAVDQTSVRDAEHTGVLAANHREIWSRFRRLLNVFSRGRQVKPSGPEGRQQVAPIALRRQIQRKGLVAVAKQISRRWIATQRKRGTLKRVWAGASFADSLYIVLSPPLRVGFFFDPWNNPPHRDAWPPELVAFTVLDVAGSLLRLWSYRATLRLGLRRLLTRPKVDPSPQLKKQEAEPLDRNMHSTTLSSTPTRPSRFDGLIGWLVLATSCCPWELVLLAALRGRHANSLHLFGLLRLVSAFRGISTKLAAAAGGIPSQLKSGTVANVILLFLVGLYLCHCAASGYMLLAHWECGLSFTSCLATTPALPGCWVLRDRLERGSRLRQYVRTLYWACKTVVTLGQGDVIPVTIAETGYRIIIQFFAGLWVTAILTAYTFYFTHKDANMTTNISTRLAQTSQFLEARGAPAQLIASVDAYFQYMQRTRNGVEEELIMAALPPHYRVQCSHYVRYKALGRLAIFRRRKGAFLRTLMGALVRDVCAPGQTLLHPGEADEMFIVVSGEIRLLDAQGNSIGVLVAGAAYAEYALFERHLARHRLEAATFCELWYLPSRSFKAALAKHFSKLVYASLLLKHFGAKEAVTENGKSDADDPEGIKRTDSVASMKKRARESKVIGHGSIIMQALEARKLLAAGAAIANADSTDSKPGSARWKGRKVAAWRLLNSDFRKQWALAECALILFLLAEVPHQIAFQRGFGLLNDFATFPTAGAIPEQFQFVDFVAALAVELFFYVDLWLRARCFVRPRHSAQDGQDFLDGATRTASSQINLLGLQNGTTIPTLATRSSHIFQLYLQHDNLVLEVLALAPVALMWDVLPKEWFTRRTVHILRFLRLLRLLRARNLRGKLHTLLSGRGVGPELRLLADVVMFCVAMSHAAACLYFAVADTASFAGGLPLGGVEPRSLSPFACLEDASVFGNCTWYMYDRSTFDIDAPYVRSILWSVVLLSTVGFGDIVAFSTRECVVDALWIFLSANICYFTSCALSSVLAQLNVLSAIRHDRIEGINVLLMSPSMASVSDATKRLVRSYYEAKWKLNGSAVGDLELLTHLPRSLRRAVSTQLYAADVRRCALFTETAGVRMRGDNGDSALFLQQLTLVITCEHFLRNVTVTKEGHLASDFFVILSGELECMLPPVPLVAPSRATSVPPSHRLTRHALHFAAFSASVRVAQKLSTSTSRLLKDRLDEAQGCEHSNPHRSSPQSIKGEQNPRPSHVPRPRSMPELSERPNAQSPRVLRYGSLVVGTRRGSWDSGAPIPISILKEHDSFGDESLADVVKLYEVSVRVVSSARVAVVRRRDFLVLAARFPQYVARLRARKRVLRAKAGQLVAAHRANFQGRSNKKIVRVLGTCESLYVDGSKMLLEKRGARVLDPNQPFARWWHRAIGGILVYNFYAIVYRLAFLPYPSPSTFAWLTGIDWVLDALLFADIYLKYGHLGYVEFGETVLDPEAIRRRYRASGYLWQDCLGMLPLYYVGDSLYMTTTRIPRLLRCLQLSELLQEVHTEIQERYLRGNAVLLSVFDLVKFFLIFVSTAHYVGSLYYLLGWLQIESGLVATSWISVDLVLIQNPNSPIVHYMRSMYWCLSAFTVDCFGDILARNFLETCYELFTCVLGWIFIGQVIGRINALMITLDKARKQRNDRVEDFQQYAKQRALPDQLRLRAMEGLVVKAQCQLELEMPTTLRDLPGSLRALVAVEMYSTLLQPLPEFAALSLAQLEAVARALALEIYLPGDMIYEANRVGTRLYLLKYGCAERFAPRTGVVYGALTPGALFGEFAFFLPGARRLASIRAVRSCQVLQLDRRVWDRLWPPDVRAQVECSVLQVVARKYRRTARSFLNVAKNFYIKSDKPVPALGRQSPSRPSLRWHQLQKSVKSKAVGASTSDSVHVSIPAFLRRSNSSGLVSVAALGPEATTPLHRRESTSGISVLSTRHEALEPIRSTRESVARLSVVRSISSVDLPVEASTSVSRADNLPPRPSTATAAVSGHHTLVNRWVLEEPSEPLARLSAATDLRWKRHEKRLRAIQLFHVDWEFVEQDLRHLGDATGTAAKHLRRASICVSPSYTDARVARLGETAARSQLGRGERRHSIQSDPTELRLKFRLSSAEVRVLEQRMVVSAATAAPSSAPALAAISVALTTVAPRSRWQCVRGRGPHKSKVAPSGATKTPQDRPLAIHSAPYRIWATPSVRMAQLDRHARYRVVWSVVMLLVTLYYAVAIPLQIGFLDAVLNDAENETTIFVVFALEYAIADLACLVDFALHRRYFVYLNSSGQPVTDPQRIARHYWRRGLCLVDLLAMVPLELLMLTFVLMLRQAGHAPPPAPTSAWPLFFSPSGGLLNWHTFAFLRVNRFLRVVHLHPLTDRIQRFLLYDAQLPGLTPSVCYIVRLALDFLLGIHWLSCLFYGVSYLAYADGQTSWLTTPDMLVFGGGVRDLAAVRAVPVLQAYLRSCHFSIGAITTVCYGDILPMNALETVVTMAVIFISVAFFSMLSGGFFKYFDMELGRRAEYEEKVAQAGHFLRFHRFPDETWRQMQVYFALSWRESRGRNERELLRGLPPSVRHDLALHVHANVLRHVALFTRCDPAFARAVVSALQLEFFVRNDVIIQRGDMERSLYIVESGLVVISAVRKRTATAEGGSGDAAAVDGAAGESAARDDASNSPPVSVNRWVAMSVRASHRARSARDSTRQQGARLLSPTATVADINERTEREEKIFKGPFDYFGERSLLFGTPRNATCVALCVSSLFVLTSARFEAILDEFPHERSNSVSAWVMTRVPATVKSAHDEARDKRLPSSTETRYGR